MPRNRSYHHKLRILMVEYDFNYEDLAVAIGRCHTYVVQRMTGKMAWDLDDVYAIRAFVNSFTYKGEPEIIPASHIAEYFPPRQCVPLGKGV